MPRTEVRVTGMAGIVANLYAADAFIAEEIKTTTIRNAAACRDLAKSLAPVRTGRLRRSLRYTTTPKGLSFTVRYDRADYARDSQPYYAPFVEFGTSRMAARPALLPAFEQTRGQYEQDIRAAVRAAIGRLRASR